MSKQVKTKAWWSISCDCQCPNCNYMLDMVDNDDFKQHVNPLELDTPATTDMDVECGNCGFEFLVTLAY